jgi:hypothetical protein
MKNAWFLPAVKTLCLSLAGLMVVVLFSCTTISPEGHYNLAVNYEEKNKSEEAEEEYKLAIKGNPDYLDAYDNLGRLYLQQTRYREAEYQLRKALSIKEDSLPVLIRLAMTYDSMDEKDREALDTWKRALIYETRPDFKNEITKRTKEIEDRLDRRAELSQTELRRANLKKEIGELGKKIHELVPPPTLILSSPTLDQFISTNRLLVKGEVNAFAGIDRVEVLSDGRRIGTPIQTINKSRFEAEMANINTFLSEGKNEITVIAYDKKGGSTTNVTKVIRKPTESYYKKKWGVVIGIDEYEHEDMPDLAYAVNDAKSIEAKLLDLGFDEVTTLVNKEATRDRISTLIGKELPSRMTEEGRREAKDDLVFIFFAGHGETEELEGGHQDGYIVPVDGNKANLLTTAISMDSIQKLSKRIPAKHIYYAFDSCYSGFALTGSGEKKKDPTIPPEVYQKLMTNLRAVQIITAGGKGEKAKELNGHGLFTEYLLRGLDGAADSDDDEIVTASEMGTFIWSQVSNAPGSQQTPQYGQVEGEGEVFFVLSQK